MTGPLLGADGADGLGGSDTEGSDPDGTTGGVGVGPGSEGTVAPPLGTDDAGNPGTSRPMQRDNDNVIQRKGTEK